MKVWSIENDRYEVAMLALGNGLSFASADNDGVLYSQVLCETLDSKDGGKIREGYSLGIFNQRGVHIIDPEGKEERALSEKYKKAAEIVEERGYSRYSGLLRDIGDKYLREAELNALAVREEDSDRPT